MTNKIQYSKKLDDGTIIVVGGDDMDEFSKNMKAFRAVAKDLNIIPDEAKATPQKAPQNGGDVEYTTLAETAFMEIIIKGSTKYGEISPFPGTKFPVKVWPEVIETLDLEDQARLNEFGTLNMGGWRVGFVRNEKNFPLKVVSFS